MTIDFITRWKNALGKLAIASLFVITIVSCEKDFDIDLPGGNTPQLVVEAYINNLYRSYNYVILSNSQNYYAANFQSIPVSGASIFITEGERLPDSTFQWDSTSRIQMVEVTLPQAPANFSRGIYFDPRIATDSMTALIGEPGKFYLLEIESDGQQYSSITAMLNPVAIDSVSIGYPFVDDDSINKVRLTNNYQDPDTLGNSNMFFWRYRDNRNNFGWGGLRRSRSNGTDDLSNGQYIRLTHPQSFELADTVNYFMASVPREVYNFWKTYNEARDNNGPFATPVVLSTNIVGTNVTGCFSGYSLSTKTVITR